MSRWLNRVELIGHLGDAPDLRMLDSGQALATFSVATSWRWRDADDGEHEETEWSRCMVWGPLVEYCGATLQKGTRVYLKGRLRTRRWEDTETGAQRERTEIVGTEMIVLDGTRVAPGQPGGASASTEAIASRPRAPPHGSWQR